LRRTRLRLNRQPSVLPKPGKIVASREQGLLTLHLPKAETVKPRKIAVAG
jgi:HSP20 family molecular chaperone IbpA